MADKTDASSLGWRKLARAIGYFFGCLWLLFSLTEFFVTPGRMAFGGLIEAFTFGGSILIATAIAWWRPLWGGFLLVLIGTAFCALLFRAPIGPGIKTLMYALLGLPPLTAGILFIKFR